MKDQQCPREIAFTKVSLPYGWLGNMSPHPIDLTDLPMSQYRVKWRTAEALFQALRFDDMATIWLIHSAASPMTAKTLAHEHWDYMVVKPRSERDVKNMEAVLKLKLMQHNDLARMLLETGSKTIIEDVTGRKRGGESARFWGAALVDGEWEGTNTLGKLWMQLRTELQQHG